METEGLGWAKGKNGKEEMITLCFSYSTFKIIPIIKYILKIYIS